MIRFVIAALSFLSLVVWVVVSVVLSIQFDRNCEGHLKRAADSNTVELARSEMEQAVSFLERNKLTEGYTSVVYTTPDEDVGFWYQNLKSSLAELKAVKADATQLERSNVLMKLRETLLDNDHVTVPSGMEKFPDNKLYFMWGLGSLVLLIGFGGAFYLFED